MKTNRQPQLRDQAGRFCKRTAITEQTARIIRIKRNIKIFADWIDPEERGETSRFVIRRILSCLMEYESILEPDHTDQAKKKDAGLSEKVNDIFSFICLRKK